MSIAYIRLSRVLLKTRKNTHRYRKLLLVPMWTVSLFTRTFRDWQGPVGSVCEPMKGQPKSVRL
jgi:hypothetical protein